MALFFNTKDFNISEPFMKALKAVNSIKLNEDLNKHRVVIEKSAKLATPKGGYETSSIMIDDISCEWIIPDFPHNPNYVILYAHGGGYTVGGLEYARIIGAKLSKETGLRVLTFDYRLAPETMYPGALDDAMTVYDYLLYQGFGADKIIIAGDSAGGNLALSMIRKIKNADRKIPAALVLFSPWTDLTASSNSYETYKDDDPILTYDYICSCKEAYFGNQIDETNPDYSPLFNDFEGFPPTLIQVGKHEILQDDSNKLCKKMKKAGVIVSETVYKDGWHVFQQMPTSLATKAIEEVANFISYMVYHI